MAHGNPEDGWIPTQFALCLIFPYLNVVKIGHLLLFFIIISIIFFKKGLQEKIKYSCSLSKGGSFKVRMTYLLCWNKKQFWKGKFSVVWIHAASESLHGYVLRAVAVKSPWTAGIWILVKPDEWWNFPECLCRQREVLPLKTSGKYLLSKH